MTRRLETPLPRKRAVPVQVLLITMVLFLGQDLSAAELTVSPRQITVDDSVTITLVLDGDFASAPVPPIPLTNLLIAGAPSVSTEFQWINGTSSRKKVLTYTARPKSAGVASVGPLALVDGSGNQVVLAGTRVSVAASFMNDSNDAAEILERLDNASRERVFLLAESNARQIVQGQQLLVTWYLYAADSVRGVHMTGSPSLSDFWVEEIPLSDPAPSELTLNGRPVQRVAIRRAALFPLRSGKLEIPPAEAVVEVIRRMEDPLRAFGLGGFGRFEASVTDVRRQSQRLALDVEPLPEGTPVDAVGGFEMRCSAPAMPGVGPVSMDVMVTGSGNLRSARAPHFVTKPEGSVSIQEGPTSVNRRSDPISMTRKWRYLLFPGSGGSFVVPTLAFDVWDPSLRARRTLQCAGRALLVPNRASTMSSAPANDNETRPERRTKWQRSSGLLIAAGALAAAMSLMILFAFRSRKRTGRAVDRAELEEITSLQETPRLLRRAVAAQAARRVMDTEKLLGASTEAAERFRALHSWIDLLEKEPGTHSANARELEARARAWLRAAGPVSKLEVNDATVREGKGHAEP